MAINADGSINVSGSITASNPSVGTDGSAIPTSSTLIGASDGTNLQQLLVESSSNRNLRVGLYSGANETTVTGSNALKVDNSAVTQPVSAASLPLPAGASTAAKQPALGTAGTASADVITIQGIASMTAVKVDGSGVTQPVSGTITANAGTGSFTVAQTTAANLNATATIQLVTGTAIVVGNNAVPVLNTAATGYVAAYGSNPAALTANTDAAFKWGAGGTTLVNHLMVQNNTAINVLWDLDTATSAGSPILTPGQTIFLDVQTTALHLQTNGTPNLNGTSANNIVVRTWL
jgi:hypothetical protein